MKRVLLVICIILLTGCEALNECNGAEVNETTSTMASISNSEEVVIDNVASDNSINSNMSVSSYLIDWENNQYATVPIDAFCNPSFEYENAPYGLDENGICFYDYGTRYENIGQYSNPTYVAAYANALYLSALYGDEIAKEKFFTQVDFLINCAVVNENYAYWIYPFEIPSFDCPKGWYSAMTSGRILGVLVRAHFLSNNNKYLEFAEKVFNKLELSRELGGMTTYSTKDEAWLEEDTFVNAPSYKVLNGHIFALAGLYDYALYTKDKAAIILTEKCVRAVLNNLNAFDCGYLSYYCEYMPRRQYSFAAQHDYNAIHLYQLLWLYDITKQPNFLQKAMRFQMYECFSPEIIANYSVDEKNHGADKMNLQFGNNYWSSSQFPAIISIDCKEVINVDKITLLGHSTATCPQEVTLQVSVDGNNYKFIDFEYVIDGQYLDILFEEPLSFQFCKIEVKTSNQRGGLVALDGIGFTQTDQALYPVFCSSNMFVGKGVFDYILQYSLLIDNDFNTNIELNQTDYVDFYIPNINGKVSLYIEANEYSDTILCYASDDCEIWDVQDYEIYKGEIVVQTEKKYIKLEIKPATSCKILEIVW